MSDQNKEPDKEFFESNPRSALIRNLCLEALGAATNIFNTDGEDKLAEAELVETNRQLAELGVTPNMHVITDTDPNAAKRQQAELKANPVRAAEWLAGQVRSLIIETNALSIMTDLSAKISEHDELTGEIPGTALIKGGSISAIRDIGMVGMLSSMIDYDAGPSDLESLQ